MDSEAPAPGFQRIARPGVIPKLSLSRRSTLAAMFLKLSDKLAMLCDLRIEAGEEGFDRELAELDRTELERLLGEACDALIDSDSQHERELRKLHDQLVRRDVQPEGH